VLPTSASVRALAARLVSRELIVFPVRHHSPACSWQLQRLLAEVRPSAVLVEGPRSFTPLIPQLVHPAARMPLAIYTYAVFKTQDDEVPPRHAAYYPFCDHSPELVALRAAQDLGIPARFVDLDFSQQCQVQSSQADEEAHSLLQESHFRRSRYLESLARQLGCRDHEEMWEHLFEAPVGTYSLTQHLENMTAYCHLARTEYTDAELRADGTLQREAEMCVHIRAALAARTDSDGPVMAILGGFHAVAIPDKLAAAVEKDTSGSGAVLSEESSAVIRYSFERLDHLNGYAAGMRSPAWYQQNWEQLQKHKSAISPRARQEVALSFLFDIALELRERQGLALPMPALAAAYQQVLQLTALRARHAPVRDDVLDAILSCFVKGEADADGSIILAVAQRAFQGKALGSVPPGGPRPPLVKDFEYRARRQRLRIDDSQPRRSTLEIYRRAEHRVTSRLFHGLAFLGIPFATRLAGPDFAQGIGLDRMQEHWQYIYSPAVEASLIEASLYGATVPRAVAGCFLDRLEKFESTSQGRDAKAAAGWLVQACVLGLHDHLSRVTRSLSAAIGADSQFESVADAAASLGLLWESREPLEARDVPELKTLLRTAYERAIYLGRDLRGSKDEGQELMSSLTRMRELLLSEAGRELDATLYWNLIASLRKDHDLPSIRGAACGLLYGAGRLSESELGLALAGHLNGMLQPNQAVSFLRGLLHTAREVAWQRPELLTVLDGLLRDWNDPDFTAILPELRLAFAAMTPKETDRIAQSVAGLHNTEDLGRLVHHDVSQAEVTANLSLSQNVIGLLREDDLEAWGL
jgi:Family of unknown function (DUF5682)